MERKIAPAISLGLALLLFTFQAVAATGDNPACISVSGSTTLGSGSILTFDIGGTVGCPAAGATEYDRFTFDGLTLSGGTLKLRLVNGFVPIITDVFDVLDWDLISGSFGTIDVTEAILPAGLAWNTDEIYTSGEISIQEATVEQVPIPRWVLLVLAGLILIPSSYIIRVRSDFFARRPKSRI